MARHKRLPPHMVRFTHLRPSSMHFGQGFTMCWPWHWWQEEVSFSYSRSPPSLLTYRTTWVWAPADRGDGAINPMNSAMLLLGVGKVH